jgi:hypothetical protein
MQRSVVAFGLADFQVRWTAKKVGLTRLILAGEEAHALRLSSLENLIMKVTRKKPKSMARTTGECRP